MTAAVEAGDDVGKLFAVERVGSLVTGALSELVDDTDELAELAASLEAVVLLAEFVAVISDLVGLGEEVVDGIAALLDGLPVACDAVRLEGRDEAEGAVVIVVCGSSTPSCVNASCPSSPMIDTRVTCASRLSPADVHG